MTPVERREQREVLRRLRRDALALCRRFGLRPSAIEAERASVRSRYGICYSDGVIKIRLRHVRTGELLKYSSLVDTLCHELAHLRHFNHGPRFQVLYRRILDYARAVGIYRPAPRQPRPASPPPPRPASQRAPQPVQRPERARPGAPVQLELF